MPKYLKDWKKFILQEKQLDLFAGTFYERPELKWKGLWPITPEEIEDLLIDLDDNGYQVIPAYGFIKKGESNKWSSWTESVGSSSEREWIPTVSLAIVSRPRTKNKITDEDLTEEIDVFIKRVKPRFKEIIITDTDDEVYDLKNVNLKNGIFIDFGDGDRWEIDSLLLQMTWFEPVYFTDKMIIEYHNLDDNLDITYNDAQQAYLTYAASKYAEWLISHKDEYYDILTDKNGFEGLWERYWDYSDQIDVDTLFQYHLNVDTVKLLVDLLINNFEEIKDVDEDEYETLTGVGITTKEQLIERVQKVGLVNIGRLLDKFDEDYISDIRSMWTDMGVSATVDVLQDEIISSLKKVIEEQLETRITKTEWKDGTPYITMKFNLDWLERYEAQDEWMGYVIQEYISNNYLDDNRLRVHMDYMEDADHTQFNNDVKAMVINGIKRKGREPITGLEKT